MLEEIQRNPGALLAVGVEPEGVRVVLLENVSGSYRLIGWLGLQQDPALDVAQQVVNVCQRLSVRLGRPLWAAGANEPLLHSEDEIRYPPLGQVTVGVMPRPRLRVWLAGLSQTIGLSPLAQVLASSPTRVVGHTLLQTGLQSGRLTNMLLQAQPEVLVLIGGYDDPAPATQQGLLLLSKVVGQAVARLAPGQRPALLVAGNRLALPQVEPLLRSGDGPLHLEVLPNLQPVPGVIQGRELATAVQQHYWRICHRMPGFALLGRWVNPPGQVTNLATNFAQLVQAWCDYQRLPELHAVYCTAEWRLHVWARQQATGIRQYFADPQAQPALLRTWPPIQLLSGLWPRRTGHSDQPQTLRWWDPSALAPILASVGQVAPLALIQVLEQDIFTESH
jgi:hypothetical protein